MNNKNPPLISSGSMAVGVLILIMGMIWAKANYDEGLLGWSAFWPLVAASVATFVSNGLAVLSHDGSVFTLVREILRIPTTKS